MREEFITKEEYQQYLSSPYWKERRNRYIQGHPKCELCGKTNNLNVHHLVYDQGDGLILFKESDADLMTLCHNCHTKMHKAIDDALLARKKCLEPYEERMQQLMEEARKKEAEAFSLPVAILLAGVKTTRFNTIVSSIRTLSTPRLGYFMNHAPSFGFAEQTMKSISQKRKVISNKGYEG